MVQNGKISGESGAGSQAPNAERRHLGAIGCGHRAWRELYPYISNPQRRRACHPPSEFTVGWFPVISKVKTPAARPPAVRGGAH